MVQPLWKVDLQCLKKLNRVTMSPSNCTPRYISNRNKYATHKFVQIITKRWKQFKGLSTDEETKCGVSIQWNIIWHEKEWSTDTHNNIKFKNMLSKRSPLQRTTYDSTYMKYPKSANL